MRIFIALIVWAACAAAATGPEIDSLISAASKLPPEFAADTLLRLATLDGLDRERKLELTQQAFDKAAQAQQAYKRRSLLAVNSGTLPFLGRANQQEMDRLDLQLRAVEAMRVLDAGRARALFSTIPRPKLAPLTCADYLGFDIDRYYKTMGSLEAEAFTEKERQAGEALRFIQPYAGTFSSPVEAGPMADVIAAWHGSDSEFEVLVSAFVGALGKIQGDDRSFTFANRLGNQMEALVQQCKNRKVSPLPLLESYRLYLVVHLSSARCADGERIAGAGPVFGMVSGQDSGQTSSGMAAFYNEHLRMAPLQPIQELESTPARLEGVAAPVPQCRELDCQVMVERYRRLIAGPEGRPISPAERASKEWLASLDAMLGALKKWAPQGYPGAELFRDKASTYNDLLNLAPAGAARDAVLRAELQFLLDSRSQAATRMEWFLPLNAMLARTTLDPAGFGAFAAEMRKSNDPVVSVYARLEAIAPRPVDKLMGLL